MSSPTPPSPRGTEPRYLMHAANLPRSLRSGDWRPFKDFVRSHIRGHPGKVEADPSRGGAWVILKSEQDALMAWEALTNGPIGGRILQVKLFKFESGELRRMRSTEDSEEESRGGSEQDTLALRMQNVTISRPTQSSYPQVSATAVAPVVSAASIVPLAPVSNPYYQPSPLYQPSESVPHTSYVQSVYGYAVPGSSVQAPAESVYQENQYGLPVNVTHGSVSMERRGVHISGLHRDVTRSRLEKLLQKTRLSGVEDIAVRLDPETGRCRGSSIVTFTSAQHVENAIDVLHQYRYMGETLRVRRAREATQVVPQPYMVVNGST